MYNNSIIVLRPFLTRKFFQEILGLEGSKNSWEKKRLFLTRKFSGKMSSPKISSGNFGSDSPSRGNFEAQNFLETRGNFTRKFWDHLIIEPKSVPFLSRRGNFPAKCPRPKFPQEILARILLAEEILKPKISWRQEEILRGNFGIT